MTTVSHAPAAVQPFDDVTPAELDDRRGHTAADARWWAENSPANADGFDAEPEPTAAEWEQAAGCALAQARLDAGIPLF